MNSVMATRILSVLKVFRRPQQCLSRCLHHSLGLNTSQSTDCLDKISSTISQHMKYKKSRSTLLVVHNPVNEMLIQKLKNQGVEKLCCTVESDENHLDYLKERFKSAEPSHDFSDNVNLCSLMVNSFTEKTILDSVDPVEGVVILSSIVAPMYPGFLRYFFNKRLVGPCTEGFYGLNSVEWFCLIPSSNIKFFYHNIASTRYFWTFHDVNICYTMKLEEAVSLLKPLDVKTKILKTGTYTYNYRKQYGSSDVSLVHLVLNFRQTSLKERNMFLSYLKLTFKNDRLIPSAEQWVPGCGKDLIYQGYSMADEIAELSSEQLFHAFKVLTSHPEYEGSALQTLLESKQRWWKNDYQIIRLGTDNPAR